MIGTLGGGDPTVKPGQMQVELYNSGDGTPVDIQGHRPGQDTTVGDLSVTFERESQFTGPQRRARPRACCWSGWARSLLFGGFVIRFMLPHKRVWGRIVARPNGGAVLGMATLATKDVAQGTEFEKLVTDIRAALQAPTQS